MNLHDLDLDKKSEGRAVLSMLALFTTVYVAGALDAHLGQGSVDGLASLVHMVAMAHFMFQMCSSGLQLYLSSLYQHEVVDHKTDIARKQWLFNRDHWSYRRLLSQLVAYASMVPLFFCGHEAIVVFMVFTRVLSSIVVYCVKAKELET